MKFEEAFEQSGLKEKYNSSGHFALGRFDEDQARMVLLVCQFESISPEALAFTWMSEASFRLCPPPNDNGKPENLENFDIGTGQANVYWTKKIIAAGHMKEYAQRDVFGSEFYETDGKTPCVFTGSPFWSLRQMAQRLSAYYKGNETEQVVHYCGPEGQKGRRPAWENWRDVYKRFFELYADSKPNT